MKSSHKLGIQILGAISARRAEEFLTDWANMPGPWPLTDMDQGSLAKFAESQKLLRNRYAKLVGDTLALGHLWLRDMLRRAWETSDPREREWLCFRLRDTYAAMVRRQDMSVEERKKEDLAADVTGPRYLAPRITPFEAAVFHFQHQGTRARRCANAECSLPYFFVGKKGQRFCSPACALPAQRESKRNWWNENRSKRKKVRERKRLPNS
jgi:hypothetical protein